MMVVLVSQCEKNALKKTRRVLDAFANRIGDNTWQTLITEDGLLTVKKMLRQTASKSTAVSCHWIRSRSRSQLLWIVGNKRQFNAEGYVPVNRTEQSLNSDGDASEWKLLPLIKSMTALAALLHDWGKATKLFQYKLNPKSEHRFKGDPLRHEWMSTLLFCALVKTGDEPENDQSWLASLINQQLDELKLKSFIKQLHQQSNPINELPDAATILVWLILSHHRLPLPKVPNHYADQTNNANPKQLLSKISAQWGYENHRDEADFLQRIEDCFVFPEGLLSASSVWLQQLSFWAKHLQQNLPLLSAALADGSWRSIAHHARLCLMLGDHYYSSQDQDASWNSVVNLYANTGRNEQNQLQLKQKLDEHLVKVAEVAVRTAKRLPYFESEPPIAQEVDQLKPPKNPAKHIKDNYGWQDKAVTKIKQYRQETEDKIQGYFTVNMASTGKGKTLANAKIMQVLSEDQESLRFILALGLRTLTLQTGDEYRNRIGLSKEQLAVLIGSRAVLELHQGATNSVHYKDDQESAFDETGSESEESLLDQQEEIDWGSEDESWQNLLPEDELTTVLTKPKDRALLYAPVLACTIDHIIAATETKRGGRYILPCLRLMSSDLVIDEVDDFVGEDLVAIGRLIHLAGMLGRKVMISSATLPPDLALSFFAAYQQGWRIYAASRDANSQIGCAWVDEFTTQVLTVSQNEQAAHHYQSLHQAFIEYRINKIQGQPAKRKAEVFSLPPPQDVELREGQYFRSIQQAILGKHQYHHTLDSETGKRVSFGVVRSANISPCIALTKFLLEIEWPDEVDVRVMAYHSQQVLLLRHEQEQHLDAVLKRKEKAGEVPDAFQNTVIRQHLDSSFSPNMIFILVATPVEEVGRDHDFDWAVIEPSSYRSIIQLAGRVRRHRDALLDFRNPNIALLQYNWKAYQGREHPLFNRPGYESEAIQLLSANLCDLVDEKQLLKSVDAIPRIKKNTPLAQTERLADLEHFVTAHTLNCAYLLGEKAATPVPKKPSRSKRTVADPTTNPKVLWGYTLDTWWMTGLPQHFNRFRKSEPNLKLFLVVDRRGRQSFQLYDQRSGWVLTEEMLGIKHVPINKIAEQRLWLSRDYVSLVEQLAERLGLDSIKVSQRFGEISLNYHDESSRYEYNDQLGLVKVKNS